MEVCTTVRLFSTWELSSPCSLLPSSGIRSPSPVPRTRQTSLSWRLLPSLCPMASPRSISRPNRQPSHRHCLDARQRPSFSLVLLLRCLSSPPPLLHTKTFVLFSPNISVSLKSNCFPLGVCCSLAFVSRYCSWCASLSLRQDSSCRTSSWGSCPERRNGETRKVAAQG